MARIDIRGKLIPNDYKWFYDWFEEDSTCPRDVAKVLDLAQDGEDLEVYINSPGGIIDVGSEIYTLLRDAKKRTNLKLYITGEACSAASVIAMAGHCEMSPTALMMVHCVSIDGAGGNHADMEHTAEVLRTADRALCTAYMEKTGMTEQEALEMMEHETWLTAGQAVERGLVDAVMFEEARTEETTLAAGHLFQLPAKEKLAQVKKLAGIGASETKGDGRSAQQKARMRLAALKNPVLQNIT